jgi:hypothetical protein
MSPTTSGPAESTEALSDLERSARLLQCAGYRTLTVAGQLGSWDVLGIAGDGRLVLVAVVAEWPRDKGRYATPAYFPSATTKLLHKWTPGEAVPSVLHIT